MLELLRASTQGWVAKLLLILLVVSFGVWGVSGTILSGPSNSVIEVGKTKVTADDYVLAYQQSRYGFSRQIGRLLTREEMRSLGLEQSVLQQLISSAILDEGSRTMGLGVSDKNLAAKIGEDDSFKDAAGRFSRERLTSALRQIGMSEAAYVLSRKAAATRQQLTDGVAANLEVPQVFEKALEAHRGQKRIFDYAVIDPSQAGKIAEPRKDEIKKYYNGHKTEFLAPEYRKLLIVKLEAEDIANPDAVSAEEVAKEYEARKQSFTDPEMRDIQQLIFKTEDEAKAAEARLNSGESFAAVAKDLGKSEDDIKLGKFARSAMPDKTVADAAFSLELNKPSGVVKGIFGPVILQVTEIVPEKVKPLSEVEADLRKRVALAQASEDLYNIHDQLEDERAAGDNLAEAAKKVQLNPRIIEAVDSRGLDPKGERIKDIPEASKLLADAFDSGEGVETDPIPIGSSGFVWYEVEGIENERQKTLDEVRDVIKSKVAAQKLTDQLVEVAKKVQTKAESVGLEKALAELFPDEAKRPQLKQSGALTRTDTADGLSSTAVALGFARKPETVLIAAGEKADQEIVFKVEKIVEEPNLPVAANEKSQLERAMTDDLLSQFVDGLRTNSPVQLNSNAIKQAQTYIR